MLDAPSLLHHRDVTLAPIPPVLQRRRRSRNTDTDDTTTPARGNMIIIIIIISSSPPTASVATSSATCQFRISDLQLGIEEVDAELRELRAELSGLVRCLLPRELRCGRRTHGCA